MTKISRNAPCNCGSGKKYKKCCLLRKEAESLEQRKIMKQNIQKVYIEEDDLDDLSNSVMDLINSGKFDEAEAVCNDLMQRYPDQVDGIDRLASVYEARGENEKAVEYYLKTVEFMRSNPGFDEEGINWTLDKVKRLQGK
ncbi:Sec-C motif-containing protein, tetratricopeptide repeat-containing [Desulfonema limicola]|uniref:Sec-C motif-containing protein, tetratricopeptide repeat-containing n=1 Tax=Desulfonema limicola TaxID=45656 RepID=A0A975GEN1_9BACT|nr:SEC-C metal-binding domain-containing protein [Desulfonema limicola]QTA78402.1 Sec-C motif-containing protein, tetratricopeptide repeat-containing [Desulfonema limicola]